MDIDTMATNPFSADTAGGSASKLKECPICFRLTLVSEYLTDRRCRDGLARRCVICQDRRDMRRVRLARNMAEARHRRWRNEYVNRQKRVIWTNFWRYEGKPLGATRAVCIYGPNDLPTRAARIAWILGHAPFKLARHPVQSANS
jgi:hypothetical protein